MIEHLPARPSWDCLACDKAWPCDPARESLAVESVDVLALTILMWTYFEDYALEAGEGPIAEAFERFLGWVHFQPSQAAPRAMVS